MALADYELAIMLMSLATKQKSAPSAGPQHHKRVIVMYITNTYARRSMARHGVRVYGIHAYVYVCAYLYACMQASEYIKRNFVFISIFQRVATLSSRLALTLSLSRARLAVNDSGMQF